MVVGRRPGGQRWRGRDGSKDRWAIAGGPQRSKGRGCSLLHRWAAFRRGIRRGDEDRDGGLALGNGGWAYCECAKGAFGGMDAGWGAIRSE